MIKTDSNGNMVWSKTFGGSDDDWAWAVQQTSDGGYIIAGYTESYGSGGSDVWLIKTDSNGNMVWSKTFGGSDIDYAESVQQTSDGGYIIAGVTAWSYGSGDVWLIKTDSNGNIEWSKTFGGSDYDEAYSVQQTSDGGYIIAGDTCSYGSCKSDVWLIKVKERSTNLPPVASFTFSPTSPTVGQTITFDASSSYDPDGSIVLYQWNFGDSNVTATTSPSITHTYSSAGTYTVTLTVRDDRGLTSTKSVTIEVSEEIGQLLIQLS